MRAYPLTDLRPCYNPVPPTHSHRRSPIMRLGLNIPQWTTSGTADLLARVQAAERLGYHSLWTAEIYGTDVVTPLASLAAHTSRIHLATGIMQITARVPTMAAITADALHPLSA